MNCGFRSVVEILKILNDALGGVLGRIPSHNTIENWIKKCGLDVYNTPERSVNTSDYALVVDESMMLGSEKLLLTLGIPAGHTGNPLSLKDVSVLDMSVSSNWTGKSVEERLLAASDKAGHTPQYVVSDNAGIMTKGVGLASLPHHHDISHSLGMLLERCYKKEADFISFTKNMAEIQFKHNMKSAAYLLPPRQRTIARFINLSNWVVWAQKMLAVYHRLNPQERAVYALVPANASLINELSEVMECVHFIEEECKQSGFCIATVDKCMKKVHNLLFNGNERMRRLGEAICNYLKKEAEILEDQKSIHNISSDIIESVFGIYKRRKSPNKLSGVTSFILFIPAKIKLMHGDIENNYGAKQHLENIRLSQIQQWENDCLTPNLVIKRINTLDKAG